MAGRNHFDGAELMGLVIVSGKWEGLLCWSFKDEVNRSTPTGLTVVDRTIGSAWDNKRACFSGLEEVSKEGTRKARCDHTNPTRWQGIRRASPPPQIQIYCSQDLLFPTPRFSLLSAWMTRNFHNHNEVDDEHEIERESINVQKKWRIRLFYSPSTTL